MVQRHIFSVREDLAGLFRIAPSIGVVCFLALIGKGGLIEPGAMHEAETWSRGIFFQFVKTWLVYFWMAPSIGAVCLLAQIGIWGLIEPGAV